MSFAFNPIRPRSLTAQLRERVRAALDVRDAPQASA